MMRRAKNRAAIKRSASKTTETLVALATWLSLATSGAAQAQTGSAIPPPPPPDAVKTSPVARSAGSLDRYQTCLQRMVDQGKASNAYMRQCLGLSGSREPDGSAPGRRGAGARGGVTKGELEGQATRTLPVLQDCYAKALKRVHELGVRPEGNLEIQLEVSSDGTVSSVKFETATLGDAILLGCVREAVRPWTFGLQPPAAGPLKAAITLRMVAVDDAHPKVVLVKGLTRVNDSGPGLSDGEILEVFREQAPRLRYCHDDLQRRRPGMSGRAVIELVVTAKGQVAKVNLTELTIPDESFATCLEVELRKWRFPRPRPAEETVVRFPAIEFAVRPYGPPPP